MSFAGILNTAKNNVDLGYFAEMIGASQGEVFRAENTGSEYHLSQGESLRLLQQAADMNRQIADKPDPNHENVRFELILDILFKYDDRIYDTGYKTAEGKTHTYTAEERQNY